MLDAARRSGRLVPILARAPAIGGSGQHMETNVASEATTISSGGGLTDRYASALYSLADDNRVLDTVVSQMEDLGRLIDSSPDFRRLLESPLIDVKTASAAAQAVLTQEGFGKEVRDFVGVITANRRLRALRDIVSAFATLVADRRGIVMAPCHLGPSIKRRPAPAAPGPPDRGRLRQRQYTRACRTRPARRPGRPDRGPPLRHQFEIPAATPAVRHEGSRVRWRSAQQRSRRS